LIEKLDKLDKKLKQNRVVQIKDLIPHPDNYRSHPPVQIRNLVASLVRFGQGRSIVIQDGPQGYLIVAGHGIVEAAKQLRWTELRADILPADWSAEQVRGYLIADNAHNEAAEDDHDLLTRLLKEQHEAGFDLASLGSDEEMLRQMLAYAEDEAAGLHEEVERPTRSKNPNTRKLGFDMIFTWNCAESLCCIAVQAGLRYGCQSKAISKRQICPIITEGLWKGRHDVAFVDNDYFDYDHSLHLSVVQKYAPKYATTKDVMTRGQCGEAGIEYAPLEQILDWGEELREHAENVIIIPKYDCVDKIPEHFMLGYSVPSSHGGTPLPTDAFRGRRVHLLGGSWKNQLAYMTDLGDDVISADNNLIALLAQRFGRFVLPDGTPRSIAEIGLKDLYADNHRPFSNPRTIAFALSVGAIAVKIRELRNEGKDEEEEEDLVEGYGYSAETEEEEGVDEWANLRS